MIRFDLADKLLLQYWAFSKFTSEAFFEFAAYINFEQRSYSFTKV